MKTSQQIADELARKAVMAHFPKDSLHPANQLAMFNAIKSTIPLVELVEVAQNAIRTQKYTHDAMCKCVTCSSIRELLSAGLDI